MVRTPGEVSHKDAMTQKARAWFRDLAVMVFGVGGEENNLNTGRPAANNSLFRRRRLERHEDNVKTHKHFAEKDIFGGHWQAVESLAFAGVQWDDLEYDKLLDHLNTLRLQVALITDFHEYNLFERMMSSDVSIRALGSMKSPLQDFALPDGLHLEQD